METTLLTDAFVFIVAVVVNFFGVMSGGAALILRPLLIFMGLPPQYAIGTTRTANVVTRLVGLTHFHKYDKIDWRLSLTLMIPATIGSLIGAEIVVRLDPTLLTKLVGYMILISGVLMALKRNIAVPDDNHIPTYWMKVVGMLSYGATTIVATLTGGGGVINNYILLFIYKKSYIASAAVRSVAGFGGALIGSAIFIYYDLVNWHYAILFMLAGAIGNHFGAKYGIHKGEEWVKRIVLIVIIVFGLRMIF